MLSSVPGVKRLFEEDSDASSVVVMCMHCRRVLRTAQGVSEWVLVEEFLSRPPSRVSHGLCPQCLDKHYPVE
jgi:hypothetical protein